VDSSFLVFPSHLYQSAPVGSVTPDRHTHATVIFLQVAFCQFYVLTMFLLTLCVSLFANSPFGSHVRTSPPTREKNPPPSFHNISPSPRHPTATHLLSPVLPRVSLMVASICQHRAVFSCWFVFSSQSSVLSPLGTTYNPPPCFPHPPTQPTPPPSFFFAFFHKPPCSYFSLGPVDFFIIKNLDTYLPLWIPLQHTWPLPPLPLEFLFIVVGPPCLPFCLQSYISPCLSFSKPYPFFFPPISYFLQLVCV